MSQFDGKVRTFQKLLFHPLNFQIFQKQSPITILRDTIKNKGIIGLYSGCTALAVGNSVKAGVRFVSYDFFKQKLADRNACPFSYLTSHFI